MRALLSLFAMLVLPAPSAFAQDQSKLLVERQGFRDARLGMKKDELGAGLVHAQHYIVDDGCYQRPSDRLMIGEARLVAINYCFKSGTLNSVILVPVEEHVALLREELHRAYGASAPTNETASDVDRCRRLTLQTREQLVFGSGVEKKSCYEFWYRQPNKLDKLSRLTWGRFEQGNFNCDVPIIWRGGDVELREMSGVSEARCFSDDGVRDREKYSVSTSKRVTVFEYRKVAGAAAGDL